MSLPQEASEPAPPAGAIAAVSRGVGWTIDWIIRLLLIPIALLAAFVLFEMATHF